MYSDQQRDEALRLLAGGMSLSVVSRLTGVSRSTLREWRNLGSRPRDVGACWVCAARTPPEPAAYAGLLGYYLGDGCLSASGSVYALRVSCDQAYPAIIEDVAGCIGGVRAGARVQRVPAPGVVVVQSYWKHWPCLFPQHGPGRKHERHLGMTEWQWAVVEGHPADFLRGLFHSDGCRVNNWARRPVAGAPKTYRYPRWQFTNVSEEILGWCGDALDLVDVPWRRSNAKTLSVSTRAGVVRLDELVGPKS
jgi:hypothetical protein